MDRYQEALVKLAHYVEAAEFKGFDPYDVLMSPIPFHCLGKWGPVLAIQMQKRSPINFRSLMGIKRSHNPKALGLFLQGYSQENNNEQMSKLFEMLLLLRTQGEKEYCWGYDFPWASPVKYLPTWSPTIVVTGFIAQGVFSYYSATKNPEALKVLMSISEFFKSLPLSENENGICFSYSTAMQDICYNASMLGAEHFARMYTLTGEEKDKELALSATAFTVADQLDNGAWNYSLNSAGEARQQIDFHQGFVLCSLQEVISHIKEVPSGFHSALAKGAEFYREKQFTTNGRSKWRWPKKWPVDIHHQAQGVITFSRLAHLDQEYLCFAEKICDHTLEHMCGKDGSFYYRQHLWGKDRTRYMRWGQAWMFLALNELIKARSGK